MNQGWVYCLSNESYNGKYKIGFTERDPLVRAKELKTTGVIYPFVVEFAKKVMDYKKVEKDLHEVFKESRCDKHREFFQISILSILTEFEKIDGIWFDVDLKYSEINENGARIRDFDMDEPEQSRKKQKR
jgi:hypothetical protein